MCKLRMSMTFLSHSTFRSSFKRKESDMIWQNLILLMLILGFIAVLYLANSLEEDLSGY